MKAACDELGVTLIAYCPLAQGEIPISFCFDFSVYDWFFVVCLTSGVKYDVVPGHSNDSNQTFIAVPLTCFWFFNNFSVFCFIFWKTLPLIVNSVQQSLLTSLKIQKIFLPFFLVLF